MKVTDGLNLARDLVGTLEPVQPTAATLAVAAINFVIEQIERGDSPDAIVSQFQGIAADRADEIDAEITAQIKARE